MSPCGLCSRLSPQHRVHRDASDAISAQIPNRRRAPVAAGLVCRDKNSRRDRVDGSRLLCRSPVGADSRARPSIWRQQLDVHDSGVDATAPLARRPRLDCLDASRNDRRCASKLGRPEHHGDTPDSLAGLVAPNTLGRGHRRRPQRTLLAARSSGVQRPLRRLELGSGCSATAGDGPHGHARQARDRSV